MPDFNFDIIEAADIKDEVSTHLKKAHSNLNPFPTEVFPQVIQDIIAETNESLCFPIDFIASSMLYAASVAIGNTYKAQVKSEWVESAMIYLAIVARAGTNKSHPPSFAIKPISERDKISFKQYERDRKEYDFAMDMTRAERSKEGIEEPVKPVWKKHLLSDYTPEALIEVHKYNKRGIGVYVDELAGWFKNFNRYNKGSEMEFWLSAWSCKPINIDRKTGDPVYIPMPFISVAGTIQTGLLNEIAKDSRAQNGFMHRILFVMPGDVKKQYWNDSDVNLDMVAGWSQIITNLLGMQANYDDLLNPAPTILKFSPEAKRVLYQWQKENTDMANDADDDALSGIYSKLETYAVRLSLILELLNYACTGHYSTSIGVEALNGALKLVEYFRTTAVKVHEITAPSTLELLPIDKHALYDSLPNTFTTKEAITAGESIGYNERTVYRFLTESGLFRKIKKGEYVKITNESGVSVVRSVS